MLLRWDWLRPLITVPCLPVLGPVHPASVSPGLLEDVISIAHTGQFLAHDENARWGSHPGEHVLAGDMIQEPGLVMIPVLVLGTGPVLTCQREDKTTAW